MDDALYGFKAVKLDHPAPCILIVKMWAFGDILMATPLLRALKSAYPDSKITWLVEREYAGALRGNPFIDDLIEFDSYKWRTLFRYGNLPGYLRMSVGLSRELDARGFDIAINLTAEKWWAIWFNKGRVRIGLFPRLRPGLMGRLYHVAIPRTRVPSLHNSEHYALPAVALGIAPADDLRIVVGISAADRKAAQAVLSASSAYEPSKPHIILHPGTSQASKCWLPQRFAQLCGQARGWNIVLTGSPSERGLCEEIAGLAQRPVVIAAGEAKALGETAALIEAAAAVVTGDTVILHIASALGTPVVGIYGSTRPRDNAPLFGPSRLLYDDGIACAPCYSAHCRMTGDAHHGCMKAVSVADVVNALTDLGVRLER